MKFRVCHLLLVSSVACVPFGEVRRKSMALDGPWADLYARFQWESATRSIVVSPIDLPNELVVTFWSEENWDQYDEPLCRAVANIAPGAVQESSFAGDDPGVWYAFDFTLTSTAHDCEDQPWAGEFLGDDLDRSVLGATGQAWGFGVGVWGDDVELDLTVGQPLTEAFWIGGRVYSPVEYLMAHFDEYAVNVADKYSPFFLPADEVWDGANLASGYYEVSSVYRFQLEPLAPVP